MPNASSNHLALAAALAEPPGRRLRRGLLREIERAPPEPVWGFSFDAGELADIEAGLQRLEGSIEALIEVESGVFFHRVHAECTFDEAEKVVAWVTGTLEAVGNLTAGRQTDVATVRPEQESIVNLDGE